MIGRLATVWREADIMRSPLLADIGPDDRQLWRPLVGALCGIAAGIVAVVVIVVVAGIAGAVLYAAQGGSPSEIEGIISRLLSPDVSMTFGMTVGLIGMLAVINGLMALVAVAVASLICKKPLKASFTAAPRFRLRQLLAGLVLYGAALALVMTVETALGLIEPGLPVLQLTQSPLQVLLFVLAAGVGLIIAAGAEELAFRGWLLRHTSAFTRNPWILLLLNSVLFSAIHMDPDVNSFIARAVMGVVFCYMALRFGGIEFAIGAHAANNLLIVLLIEPMTLKVPPPEPLQAHFLIESAILLVIGIAVTEAAFRIPALRRWTGADSLPTGSRSEVFR